MNQIINKILGSNRNTKSFVIWHYQLPNQSVKTLKKHGKYWQYEDSDTIISCSTLSDAKGDILYSGGKVWKEIIPNV